jgi:hypothetical protein
LISAAPWENAPIDVILRRFYFATGAMPSGFRIVGDGGFLLDNFSSLTTAFGIFGVIVIGIFIGVWLGRLLPTGHLSKGSQDTIMISIGMVAAMTSLVLGLLTAEVKSSYDTADSEIKQQAARLLEMNMGTREIDAPAAATIRQNLARLAQLAVAETFEGAGPQGRSAEIYMSTYRTIMNLPAPTILEQQVRSDLHDELADLAAHRVEVLQATKGTIPAPFLYMMVAWTAMIFMSWAIFAPRNATVICILVICAASVSGALFLILEMDSPFDGIIAISSEPLRGAIAALSL